MRILVEGDNHGGSIAGLTPRRWQPSMLSRGDTPRAKLDRLIIDVYNERKRLLKKYGPFDRYIHTGDSLEGKGWRSGGTELITTSMEEQAEIAVAGIDEVRLYANRGFKSYGVRGTGYHTAVDGDDWDNIVAKDAGFDAFDDELRIRANGYLFDVRHHVGTSSTPYGRFTAIAKANVWGSLIADREKTQRADCIIRGHAHYALHCGDPTFEALICPSLQLAHTKYGKRRCEGRVDFGITVIDVDKHGKMTYVQDVTEISTQLPEIIDI